MDVMKDEELIEKADEVISELVYDKVELQKAYNYYHGVRDPEQFAYLEENFGIGSPTSVEFTPLLKKHVDALVGEYLGTPILPKVSCKDTNTISNIARDKQLEITAGIVKFLKEHLTNSLLQFIDGKDTTDKSIKQQLDKVIQDIDQSFVSQYEIAAQNIIQYIIQSRDTDFQTKLRRLLIDLLVSGYTYFRVIPSQNKSNIRIQVLNPLNTFTDDNTETPYARDSSRAVIREWLTRAEIINKYGKELSKEDLKNLKDEWTDERAVSYRHRFVDGEYFNDDCTYKNVPGYPEGNHRFRLMPVYDVEWIETDDDFVMQRYNVIRIGDNKYILRGLDKSVIRSRDNETQCRLTINGVYFFNNNNEPYSLILKCMHLQDRYDILNYYRDKLVANSGVAGSIIDLSLIPASLGVKFTERIQKWIAYKKGGLQLIDTTQEGRNDNGNAPMNTIFNGYDETLKAQAVQAIEIAIKSVEDTTSSITGVFRERLNGIEQQDAVTNIKQGVHNSFTITKHYFQQMDLITCEILMDSLNQAKIVYKKGLTGTLLLGERQQRIFTALPEYYTLTDFDIHIISSTEVMEDIQTIKSLIPELIKAQALPPEILFEVMTAKSLTDIKYKVQKAIKAQKEENDQLKQLSQKLEETTQQAQQLQQELEKTQKELKKLDQEKLKIEQQKINLEYQVNWFKAKTDQTYKERQMDIEEKRTQIELAQLHDGNPYNDKIRQLT